MGATCSHAGWGSLMQPCVFQRHRSTAAPAIPRTQSDFAYRARAPSSITCQAPPCLQSKECKVVKAYGNSSSGTLSKHGPPKVSSFDITHVRRTRAAGKAFALCCSLQPSAKTGCASLARWPPRRAPLLPGRPTRPLLLCSPLPPVPAGLGGRPRGAAERHTVGAALQPAAARRQPVRAGARAAGELAAAPPPWLADTFRACYRQPTARNGIGPTVWSQFEPAFLCSDSSEARLGTTMLLCTRDRDYSSLLHSSASQCHATKKVCPPGSRPCRRM